MLSSFVQLPVALVNSSAVAVPVWLEQTTIM
jgi:hypothetical protein